VHRQRVVSGSRSPSIVKCNAARANSSSFTILLPVDLSVSNDAPDNPKPSYESGEGDEVRRIAANIANPELSLLLCFV
jgi:hypothetical protein